MQESGNQRSPKGPSASWTYKKSLLLESSTIKGQGRVLESFQVGSFDLLGTVARKQQLPLGKAPHNATFMKEIR